MGDVSRQQEPKLQIQPDYRRGTPVNLLSVRVTNTGEVGVEVSSVYLIGRDSRGTEHKIIPDLGTHHGDRLPKVLEPEGQALFRSPFEPLHNISSEALGGRGRVTAVVEDASGMTYESEEPVPLD